MNIYLTHITRIILLTYLIGFSNISFAEDRVDMKGISIIGNKELPNVLYIVPWKSPDMPDMNEPPLASLIDAALEPVDRESILRKELYNRVLEARKVEVLNKSKKEE
jgi:hypothetical protein